MQLYDMKCPICGAWNRKLYLEETNGWMECECCKQVVKVLPFAGDKKVPVFTPEKLAACFVAAN